MSQSDQMCWSWSTCFYKKEFLFLFTLVLPLNVDCYLVVANNSTFAPRPSAVGTKMIKDIHNHWLMKTLLNAQQTWTLTAFINSMLKWIKIHNKIMTSFWSQNLEEIKWFNILFLSKRQHQKQLSFNINIVKKINNRNVSCNKEWNKQRSNNKQTKVDVKFLICGIEGCNCRDLAEAFLIFVNFCTPLH